MCFKHFAVEMGKMSRISVTLMVFLLSMTATAVAGDYYKWVDENGTVHVSDSLAAVPSEHRDQIAPMRLVDPEPSPPTSTPEVVPPAAVTVAAPPAEAEFARFEVPFTQYEGHSQRILLKARFNGRVTGHMLLDTGSPDTVISLNLARKLGLLTGDEGALLTFIGGIGGSKPSLQVILDEVRIGKARTEFVPARIIARPMSPEYDGVIGMGFVTNYNVTIDSRRGVVVFQEMEPDPNAPAGRPAEWWRHTYAQFAGYRNDLQEICKLLQRRRYSTNSRPELDGWLAGAKVASREAEQLYAKLNRYAIQHDVPMEWREWRETRSVSPPAEEEDEPSDR
jgi:hypothetical protein